MARKRAGAGQTDLVLQRRAGAVQQAVESPFHREDGRPGIDPGSADLDLAHLAAGRCGAFHDMNVMAGGRQRNRGRQPGNPRPHNDNTLAAHCGGHWQFACIDITSFCVNLI